MKTKTSLFALLLINVFLACNKPGITPPANSATASASSQLAAPFSVGQSYGGGIIFFVDTTGQHGLIAATEDANGGFYLTWSNGNNVVTKATAIGVYKGATNTNKIINAQGNGSYAAEACSNYNGGGYTDWYLGSKREMVLLRKNGGAAGLQLSSNSYYTSTEADANTAYLASPGATVFTIDKSIPASVRPIRAF